LICIAFRIIVDAVTVAADTAVAVAVAVVVGDYAVVVCCCH